MPLGENGFANLSFEYGNSDPTDRSVQRADATALIAAGNPAVRNPAQVWGSPEERNNAKFFGNFGKLINDSTQLYAHTNYASRKVTGGFFFRNPNTRAAVFSGDGGQTLLIGDALDAEDGVLDGSAGCPAVPIVDNVPDQDALGRVFADPNCFSFQEIFPGGFTPNFGGFYVDNSIVGGARGQFAGGLNWDLSASVGTSEVDFFISNTVNASLGPDTPTEFSPGLYRQEDVSLNFDIAYEASEFIHFAAGTEFRNEGFTIEQGQAESWQFGPYAAQGFSAASNGFPGFSPIAVGSWDRRNSAVYADIELSDIDDRFIVGGALRFERFTDFGNTLNWKTAARVELADGFALRASTSTGFRAPTPGQQNAFNVSTQFDPTTGELVNRGTIPSNSRVAALRGGTGLQPETSLNFTAGAIAEGDRFTLTSDFFRIAISDRLALSQNFNLNQTEVADLIAQGVTSAGNLRSFRFFINDFDTVTQGVDIVAVVAPTLASELSVLYNHTSTAIIEYNPALLSDERIRRLKFTLPENRLNATWKQRIGRFELMGPPELLRQLVRAERRAHLSGGVGGGLRSELQDRQGCFDRWWSPERAEQLLRRQPQPVRDWRPVQSSLAIRLQRCVLVHPPQLPLGGLLLALAISRVHCILPGSLNSPSGARRRIEPPVCQYRCEYMNCFSLINLRRLGAAAPTPVRLQPASRPAVSALRMEIM